MKQMPRFIQKALLQKTLSQKPRDKYSNTADKNHQSIEYSLADQIACHVPLLELQDKRQLLEVEVVGNNHPQSYQSMIVGVDFIKHLLLLDSLMPVNPYCPIVLGDQLIVTHKQLGQVLSFRGALVDIIHERDNLIYAMELPNDIAYQQRRFYPRLVIGNSIKVSTHLSVKLKSPLKTPWHCTLTNISAGGIRVSVPGKVAPQLSPGKLLPAADIQFHQVKINCPLLIKSFRYERRPYEHTEISLAFDQINVQDRVRLQNFINFYLSAEAPPETLAS